MTDPEFFSSVRRGDRLLVVANLYEVSSGGDSGVFIATPLPLLSLPTAHFSIFTFKNLEQATTNFSIGTEP